MTQQNKSPFGHFGDRLDNLMQRVGINGVELAAKAGMTPTAVSRYKQGRIPAAEELLRLATVLGVSMEWLLTGDGSPPAWAGADNGNLGVLKAETRRLLSQLEAVEVTAKKLRSLLGK